ncbi:phosphoribosyltransferase family protein, partial [Xanthomonas graminis]
RHAFAVQAPLPAHVALIDDVMTTGATLHAAARALRRAGVARVDAWVVARVP